MSTTKKDMHLWTSNEIEALVRHLASASRQAGAARKRVVYADALNEFAFEKGIPFKAVEKSGIL